MPTQPLWELCRVHSLPRPMRPSLGSESNLQARRAASPMFAYCIPSATMQQIQFYAGIGSGSLSSGVLTGCRWWLGFAAVGIGSLNATNPPGNIIAFRFGSERRPQHARHQLAGIRRQRFRTDRGGHGRRTESLHQQWTSAVWRCHRPIQDHAGRFRWMELLYRWHEGSQHPERLSRHARCQHADDLHNGNRRSVQLHVAAVHPFNPMVVGVLS